MAKRSSSRGDPLLEALDRLRPAGVEGPLPGWLRALVVSGDVEVAVADARSESPATVIAWLAALLTEEAVDTLGAVADDEAVQRVVHALCLVDRPDTPHVEAVADALVGALHATEGDDPALDLATEALADLVAERPEALEILLAAHASVHDDEATLDLYEEVLAVSTVDDPRVRAVLLRRLAREPARGARLVGLHGDPRCAPALQAAWDALPATPPPDDVDAAEAGESLGRALERFDDSFDATARAKLRAYADAAAAFAREDMRARPDEAFGLDDEIRSLLDEVDDDPVLADASPLTRALDDAMGLEPVGPPVPPLERKATPGRNDPCWCGSGRKYKKCHHDADAAKG